ncbi:hypothetical protein [Streptosporangium sp. G12]
MRVRVHFRIDSRTGEVEKFIVEDISVEPEAEHESVHDRIAVEVGRVVERRPAPEQVMPDTVGGDATPLTYQSAEEFPPTPAREEAKE